MKRDMVSPEIIYKHYRGSASAGCIYILMHSDRYLDRQNGRHRCNYNKKRGHEWGGVKRAGGVR